jgi:hypothetical protein
LKQGKMLARRFELRDQPIEKIVAVECNKICFQVKVELEIRFSINQDVSTKARKRTDDVLIGTTPDEQ